MDLIVKFGCFGFFGTVVMGMGSTVEWMGILGLLNCQLVKF